MRQYKIPKEPTYTYTITELTRPLTRHGEEFQRLKINPNKRHSAKNTIIGWNIYKDGVLEKILYQKIED